MDPIERIAQVFSADCENAVLKIEHMIKIVDGSSTYDQAYRRLVQEGLYNQFMEDKLASLQYELQQLTFCLESLEEIKDLAKRVLVVHFYDDERFLAFNQEICFSFACKFISSIGPRLAHFSNASLITKHEVQQAEIDLAMTAPNLLVGPDLFCYETM